MTATFQQATDEIFGFFKTAWDTTGHLALYPNIAGSPPATQVPWARVNIQHTPGGKSSLSDPSGLQRFTRNGFLAVQVFIPNGQGLLLGWTLCKIISDAFEGKATASHVWFREVRVTPIGPDGEWYQFNVLVDFTYDEVK